MNKILRTIGLLIAMMFTIATLGFASALIGITAVELWGSYG